MADLELDPSRHCTGGRASSPSRSNLASNGNLCSGEWVGGKKEEKGRFMAALGERCHERHGRWLPRRSYDRVGPCCWIHLVCPSSVGEGRGPRCGMRARVVQPWPTQGGPKKRGSLAWLPLLVSPAQNQYDSQVPPQLVSQLQVHVGGALEAPTLV